MKAVGAIFVDTWGWLALGHRRDAHHVKVKELMEACASNRTLVHTSDYVLDELITLLFRREAYEEAVGFLDGLLANAARGTLRIQRVTNERFHAALELRRRFRDKPDISFTDLTTMTIMRDLDVRAVLTEDNHFLQVGMGFERLP